MYSVFCLWIRFQLYNTESLNILWLYIRTYQPLQYIVQVVGSEHNPSVLKKCNFRNVHLLIAFLFYFSKPQAWKCLLLCPSNWFFVHLLVVHSLVSSARIWIPLVWTVKTDWKPQKREIYPQRFLIHPLSPAQPQSAYGVGGYCVNCSGAALNMGNTHAIVWHWLSYNLVNKRTVQKIYYLFSVHNPQYVFLPLFHCDEVVSSHSAFKAHRTRSWISSGGYLCIWKNIFLLF